MYSYKNYCYSTQTYALHAVASDCNGFVNGDLITCTVNGTGIDVTRDDGVNQTTYSYTPIFNDCVIDIEQVQEFSMLPVSLLAAGFVIMMIKRVIK